MKKQLIIFFLMMQVFACQWNLDKVVLDCDLVDCVNGICNDSTGECECEDGWSGVLCEDVGEGSSNPCEGVDCVNGACNEETGECECEDGYWGVNCDKEVVTFEKTFGGIDYDIGNSVIQTIDGCFIITGSTKSYGNGLTDVYLLKTDANGNELWNRTFGGSDDDYGYSVAEMTDGGFIIVGYTDSYGDRDVYLIKTDSQGNEVWSRTLGEGEYDYGYSVKQIKDSNFVITGSTPRVVNGYSDVYFLKTDSDGNELWSKTFGGGVKDIGRSVAETTDNGFIITGYTRSYGNGQADVYLLKIDSDGNELWSKTFGGSEHDVGNSVEETADGGFIITGNTGSYGNGGSDIYMVKTDVNGSELWSRTFGGSEFDLGNSVEETADGGFIITGSYENGINNVYLIKTDSNGNELWSRTFGGSENDRGHSVKETSDGGFIITGSTYSYGSESGDVYLIKTDANGNL